jgi:hypothetical protein
VNCDDSTDSDCTSSNERQEEGEEEEMMTTMTNATSSTDITHSPSASPVEGDGAGSVSFELVLFDRPSPRSVFSAMLRSVATEVIEIGTFLVYICIMHVARRRHRYITLNATMS